MLGRRGKKKYNSKCKRIILQIEDKVCSSYFCKGLIAICILLNQHLPSAVLSSPFFFFLLCILPVNVAWWHFLPKSLRSDRLPFSLNLNIPCYKVQAICSLYSNHHTVIAPGCFTWVTCWPLRVCLHRILLVNCIPQGIHLKCGNSAMQNSILYYPLYWKTADGE